MFGNEARDIRMNELEKLVYKFARQVDDLETKIIALTTVSVPYEIQINGLHVSGYKNFETMRLDTAVAHIINHLGLKASIPKPPVESKLIVPPKQPEMTMTTTHDFVKKSSSKNSK